MIFESRSLETTIVNIQLKEDLHQKDITIQCYKNYIRMLETKLTASNTITAVFKEYYFRFLKHNGIDVSAFMEENEAQVLPVTLIEETFIQVHNTCNICLSTKSNVKLACNHRYCFMCFAALGDITKVFCKGKCVVCQKPVTEICVCDYDWSEDVRNWNAVGGIEV